MSNMSYCRFQNTKSDLQDCKEAFEEAILNDSEEHKLGQQEAAAFVEMIETMREFLDLINTHSEIDTDDIYNLESLREAFPELIDE